MNKEAAYDEHISPLMTKIIALCKEHKINMAAQFVLDRNDEDEPLYCTTVLLADPNDDKGHARIMQCRRVMYPSSGLAAITITGGSK